MPHLACICGFAGALLVALRLRSVSTHDQHRAQITSVRSRHLVDIFLGIHNVCVSAWQIL